MTSDEFPCTPAEGRIVNSRPMPLAPRTSRDVCRDACAIEAPAPRRSIGHALIAPIGIACLVDLYFVLRSSS